MEKETIELVKKMIEDGNLSQEIAEKYCPDLKESEDEKIRKYIIKYFEASKDELSEGFKWNGITVEECIAWLERQGGPKSYWKPTKEQYEALDYAYNSCSDTERGNYYEGVLETLIEDLHRLEKQGEQNLAWSEEDEKIFDRICDLIHSAAYSNCDVDEDGNECGEYANIKRWFSLLKDRVQPKQ